MTARGRGTRVAGGALAVGPLAAAALAAALAAACDPPATSLQTRRTTAAPSVVCGARSDAVRSCTYTVAGTQVRATDSGETLVGLAVWQGGGWRPLPVLYGSHLWSGCHLPVGDDDRPLADRIASADVDGDGRRDVTVVAACEPWAGGAPDGLRPFPVVSVYTQEPDGRYTNDPSRDSALTAALPDSCAQDPCDVAATVRRLLGRPSPAPDPR